MSALKAFSFLIILLFLSSCTTARKSVSPDEDEVTTPESRPKPSRVQRVAPLDMNQLSRKLGMNYDVTDTGFYEKPFNDCELPREHRLSSECSTRYFTAIQFRVRCRDSEGTVENVSSLELVPLTTASLRWNLGPHNGVTSTTDRGFGKIMVLSASSMKRRQFRLTHNNQIMGVRAAEVRQFVLPRYWCQ